MIALLIAVVSCGRTEGGGREDRAELLRAARSDGQTLAVLREVEALVRSEDRARAAQRLRTAALPAADRALTAAEALRPRTADGGAARDELLSVLHLRREAIEAYLAAVESRDDMKLLDAIRQTREVEEALVDWEATAMKVGRRGASSGGGCGR